MDTTLTVWPRALLYGSMAIAVFLTFGLLYILQSGMSKPKSATLVFSAPLALESTRSVLQSVQLALSENEYRAGDISLDLVILEDGDETGAWIEEKEEQNARTAIAIENTVAYIGPLNSGAAKISMPILNKAGIAQISSAATWPGLTKIGFQPGEPGIFYPTGIRHFVRTCTTDDLQGPAGARWARELGFTSVFVVDDGESYGIGIARLFQAAAIEQDIHVAGRMSISSQSDFEDAARTIAASDADLVYYGGITPNGGPELLRRLREHNPDITFMGPDGIFEQDFLNLAGDAAEGVYLTAVGISPTEIKTEAAEAYLAAYRENYHEDPEVFGALAYDATKLLLAAIERAGVVNRSDILREIRATRNFEGVMGTMSFDANGDTTAKIISGSRVEGDSFVFVKDLSE